MLSKALILVLCAATTYFVLAISALKINLIRGIEPRPFTFTLSFATLIKLPFLIVNELNHVVFYRSGCR
jgi:hypothetical protein